MLIDKFLEQNDKIQPQIKMTRKDHKKEHQNPLNLSLCKNEMNLSKAFG